MLNPLNSIVPLKIINKKDFKVKSATIKKDKDTALKDKMLKDNTETLEEIKRRKKQDIDNKRY